MFWFSEAAAQQPRAIEFGAVASPPPPSTYRLPTGDEWEWAARGGAAELHGPYGQASWGCGYSNLRELAAMRGGCYDLARPIRTAPSGERVTTDLSQPEHATTDLLSNQDGDLQFRLARTP